MFYGFPAKSGSSEGVKVAMHFQKSESSSAENTCTPDSLDKTVIEKEVNEVSKRLVGALYDSSTIKMLFWADRNFQHFLSHIF